MSVGPEPDSTIASVTPAPARDGATGHGTPVGVTSGVTSGVTETRVGLQGIYTAQRQVFAYELLYRSGRANHAQLSGRLEHDRATAQVIGTTFAEFGVEDLAGGRRLFLNATRSFFTGELPLPFDSEGVVLELLETVEVDHLVMAGLHALKRRGFEIAVDDFDGELSRVPAVLHADYVKIDLEATAERLPQVIALVRRVNPKAVVLVERVETEEQFTTCQDLNVDLYQGYLLHRPDVVQRQTLSPEHLTCVQLLALLTDLETPVEQVLEHLSSDPGLSVRVLTTVSSAAYAPRGGVTSLRQAVVMLGRQELLGWITLLLLAHSGSVGVQEETITWIFTRAEACRLLTPTQPDAGFTVGLLSGAAEALGFDPGELTRGCRLQPQVRDALVLGAGPLGAAVDAVRAHAATLEQNHSPAGDVGNGSRVETAEVMSVLTKTLVSHQNPGNDQPAGGSVVEAATGVAALAELDVVSRSYLKALVTARARTRRLM